VAVLNSFRFETVTIIEENMKLNMNMKMKYLINKCIGFVVFLLIFIPLPLKLFIKLPLWIPQLNVNADAASVCCAFFLANFIVRSSYKIMQFIFGIVAFSTLVTYLNSIKTEGLSLIDFIYFILYIFAFSWLFIMNAYLTSAKVRENERFTSFSWIRLKED
jgi:hypothetical protein